MARTGALVAHRLLQPWRQGTGQTAGGPSQRMVLAVGSAVDTLVSVGVSDQVAEDVLGQVLDAAREELAT